MLSAMKKDEIIVKPKGRSYEVLVHWIIRPIDWCQLALDYIFTRHIQIRNHKEEAQ